MSAAPKDLESSLTKLSINPQPSKSSSSFRKKQSVADSWDDESDSGSDTSTDTGRPLSPQTSANYPSAPPPTPISPSHHESFISPYGYGSEGGREERRERTVRPEKTDAVAKRMIAGALGVKAPKKTEEQRAYDRAIKEKEMKRRNKEKEDEARKKEEAEKAKAAVWED